MITDMMTSCRYFGSGHKGNSIVLCVYGCFCNLIVNNSFVVKE